MTMTQTKFNNTQTSLMDFNTIRYALKSSQNFRRTFHYDHSLEKDINPLYNLYISNDQETNSKKNQHRDSDFDSIDQDITTKYNISNKLKMVEKEEIQKYFKTSAVSKNEQDSKSKTSCKIRNEYFKSPYESYQILKLNKQIYNNIKNIVTNKQVDKYMNNFNNEEIHKKKIKNMPDIKVIINPYSIKSEKNSDFERAMKLKISTAVRISSSNSEPAQSNQEFSNKVSRENLLHKGLDFHCSLISSQCNKPKSRAQSSMIIQDDTMYIFGGLNNVGLEDLWVATVKFNEFKWKLLKPVAKFNPNGRYGHTSIYYNKSIYIYGGHLNDYNLLNRDYLDYVIVYNIETNRFNYELGQNKKDVKMRRNHICELINSQMVIHGGIEEDLTILNDMFYLDLINLRWIKIEVSGEKPYLAYHSSALVLSTEKRLNSNTNIYKFHESLQSNQKKVLKSNKIRLNLKEFSFLVEWITIG